jgi:hypothetical protein
MSLNLRTLVDANSQFGYNDIYIDVIHIEVLSLPLNSPFNFVKIEFFVRTVSFNNILFLNWFGLAAAWIRQLSLLVRVFSCSLINDL